MIDIKSLFLTAKKSGTESDISAYTEAVNNIFESSPRDYVLQLEYIIQSSTGIDTLIPFIEKWGMPLALYDTIYECVTECIDLATKKKADVSSYTEAKDYLEKFRKDHIHCFAMYEFYCPDDVSDYVKSYYGFTKNHQNRYLGAGMVQKFGEFALPDALITALPYAKSAAAQKFYEYIDKMDRTPLENEFLKECFNDIGLCHTSVLNESASTIVNSMHEAHHEVFREAMIMGDEDAVYEYTEEQMEAIRDLVSYKEYMITWADETGDDIQKLTEEAYNLFEEADSVEEDHSEEKKKLKDSDYVPIFAVLQSYQHDLTDNYGKPKDKSQKSLADVNKVIRFLSKGDKFSHALISLDDDLNDVYSYGSQGFEKAPIETDRFWITTDEIYICVMFLTKDEFDAVKKFINKQKSQEKETSYGYSNLLKMCFGKPVSNNKRHVCSTFVAATLQQASPKLLHRDPFRIRPEDMTIIPRSFYVMTFKDRDDFLAKKSQFKARVKAIKEEHIDEIKDYNNELPKIMLKEQIDKRHTIDKIIDWFSNRAAAKMDYKKRVD